MTIELLDLTNKIDNVTVSTLTAVNQVAAKLQLPYIVVGATARDLVLHHGYGAPIQRATVDIDFAIQVDTWKNFNEMTNQLLENGFMSTPTQHRLISPVGLPIDIVPFGGLEEHGTAQISWPPDGDLIMSMRGFREACDNAQLVLVSHDPKVTCPVVTPEGLTVLKLISWAERPRVLRRKDAEDLHYLLTTYYEIKNINEQIYDDDNALETERYDWEPNQSACSLLGKECRKFASKETVAEILELKNTDNEKSIEKIAEEMASGIADKNLLLLEAFMNGFELKPTPSQTQA